MSSIAPPPAAELPKASKKLEKRIDELNKKCTQVLFFLSFALAAAGLLWSHSGIYRPLEWWVCAIFPVLIGILPLKDFWPNSHCWFCFIHWLKVAVLWLSIIFIFVGAVYFFRAIPPAVQPQTPSKAEIETLLLQPATVTEVFHLRGECAALGGKIENKNKSPEETVVDTEISYSVAENRCYVLIRRKGANVERVALYDGRTEEVLAFAMTSDGRQMGTIGRDQDGQPKYADYSKALDYINRLMGNGEQKHAKETNADGGGGAH